MKTLSPRRLKVAVYLVLAMLLFGLFVQLANMVILNKQLETFDLSVANFIYGLRTTEATAVMQIITSIANTSTVIMISLTVLIALYLTRQKRHILPILFAMIGAGVFSALLKLYFGRPRPDAIGALVTEGGFSFPSGHTLIGICFYGVLAYFLVMEARNWGQRVAVAIAGTLLVLAIGFSRIYLGVHWPTDVLGSLLLGSAWLFLLAAVFQYYDKFSRYLHRKVWRSQKS